jgi:hypothetical protein
VRHWLGCRDLRRAGDLGELAVIPVQPQGDEVSQVARAMRVRLARVWVDCCLAEAVDLWDTVVAIVGDHQVSGGVDSDTVRVTQLCAKGRAAVAGVAEVATV